MDPVCLPCARLADVRPKAKSKIKETLIIFLFISFSFLVLFLGVLVLDNTPPFAFFLI
jgi:hypothetical protein